MFRLIVYSGWRLIKNIKVDSHLIKITRFWIIFSHPQPEAYFVNLLKRNGNTNENFLPLVHRY